MDPVRQHRGDFHWKDVEVLKYKDEGSAPFKDVTRQVLFGDPAFPAQLRYFEVQPGGWTTLERHEHVHAVMVIRGKGRVLVGDVSQDIGQNDLVSVPPLTWHQFQAAGDQPLGFLCMVASERDKPQLPADHERDAIARPLRKPGSDPVF